MINMIVSKPKYAAYSRWNHHWTSTQCKRHAQHLRESWFVKTGSGFSLAGFDKPDVVALLLKPGDVELNPGPFTTQARYPCPVETCRAESSPAELAARIHHKCVSELLKNRPPNAVLGEAPPEIDPNEAALPRSTRTKLSQLRSGASLLLGAYRHKIGRAPSPLCQLCSKTEDTTSHRFACSANATGLQPVDLWRRPRSCADFFGLDH